jgi:hypothetical protein
MIVAAGISLRRLVTHEIQRAQAKACGHNQ